MLLQYLRMPGFTIGEKLVLALFAAAISIFSLSIHEFSHAATACALGDKTAKYQGRMTLNPAHHLDPIGTFCSLFLGFGWAKPVPINPRNFKKPKWGMAISALMGPVSNFTLSFLSIVALVLVGNFYPASAADSLIYKVGEMLRYFLSLAHIMNLSLAIFNFIPVPPLDGSRVLSVFLPADKYFQIMKYEKYLAIGLIVLLYIGVLDGPLSFIVTFISGSMELIVQIVFNLIFSLFA